MRNLPIWQTYKQPWRLFLYGRVRIANSVVGVESETILARHLTAELTRRLRPYENQAQSKCSDIKRR